jgi:DNA-binding transcriptional LysR family regulator
MSTDGDMAFFALLARHGSFTTSALELGLSPSAVSRRLARLEGRLGVRLMNRTTRRASLTSEGEAYLQAATDILERVRSVEQSFGRARERPLGLLRVNATFQFGRERIAPAIGAFVREHPEVEAQLVLSDAPRNLVDDGFDLGIRFGLPPASSLVARLLLRNRRVLVAAPAYLQRHGAPRALADLAHHSCIVLRQEYDPYDIWRFDSVGGESVRVGGRLATNDGEIAVGWVLDGHGIMMRSEWDVNRHIEAGRLEVVLPSHHSEAHIYAVYPERLHLSAKVRRFVDLLAERL